MVPHLLKALGPKNLQDVLIKCLVVISNRVCFAYWWNPSPSVCRMIKLNLFSWICSAVADWCLSRCWGMIASSQLMWFQFHCIQVKSMSCKKTKILWQQIEKKVINRGEWSKPYSIDENFSIRCLRLLFWNHWPDLKYQNIEGLVGVLIFWDYTGFTMFSFQYVLF